MPADEPAESVTDWNSNTTMYSYDDAHRMTTATLPSGTGIVSTYTYDVADRLTDIEHVKNGSTTVEIRVRGRPGLWRGLLGFGSP